MIGHRKLFLNKERKKISEEIKSNGFTWFTDCIVSSAPIEQLYLTEPIIECLRNVKIKLDQIHVDLIGRTLLENLQCVCQLFRQKNGLSNEEIKILGQNCHSLTLLFKSQYQHNIPSDSLEEISDQIIDLIANDSVFICRDYIVLILPFTIFINTELLKVSVRDQWNKIQIQFENCFHELYLLCNWQSLLLKQSDVNLEDKSFILSLFTRNLGLIETDPTIWFHFIIFDILLTSLKRHQRFFKDQDELLIKTFCLVRDYTDCKGLNVEKVGEDIQITCLKLNPGLLSKVKELSDGPWYCRNTLTYLNMYLKNVKLLDLTEIVSYLKQLLSHLGFNRLDHSTAKVIKTLLDRHLVKDNFLELLKICLDCVKSAPLTTRVVALYVAPSLRKEGSYPDNLESFVADMMKDGSVSDGEKVVLFETFPGMFKKNISEVIQASQLPESGHSDVNISLVTLIIKNPQDFTPDLIVRCYKNLLTLPCPTIRQHIVASFQNMAKTKSEDLKLRLSEVFIEHLDSETPYHSLLISLHFFLSFGVDFNLEGVKDKLFKLTSHSDSDISCLAKQITPADHQSTSPNNDNTVLSSSLVDNFVSLATGTQTITDVTDSVLLPQLAELQTHLTTFSSSQTLVVTRTALTLIETLLTMISRSNEQQTYTAPSFEETFLIIQESLLGADEEFCIEAGTLVWGFIAGLLGLLGKVCKVLVDDAVEGFIRHQNTTELEEVLLQIGKTCLVCVFRCRHRSVINASCETLKLVSVSCSPNPPTFLLPGKWLDVLLQTLCNPADSSLSRRSAGLPEAIEAILQCNSVNLTIRTVQTLLRTADLPIKECTDNQDLVQVHSLHMLRLVMTSAKLRSYLIPFISKIGKLCYSGFIHDYWVVRNASFLLFADLVHFVLGHKSTELDSGYRSVISISELKRHYPGIYDLLTSNLDQHSNSRSMSCPSIFLSLMLSSKLYPDPTSAATSATIGDSLFRLLSSPIFKIRSVAARNILLVCPRDVTTSYLGRVGEELRLGVSSSNRLHGLSLLVLQSVKAGYYNVDTISQILSRFVEIPCTSLVRSAIVQTCVILRNKTFQNDELNEQLITKLQLQHEHSSPTPSSEFYDHLGLWWLAGRKYDLVLDHIKQHYGTLTDVFWCRLHPQFYRSLDMKSICWFLSLIAESKAKYTENYLVDCVFSALNIAENHLTLPGVLRTYFNSNISRYPHLCLVLSVTHGVELDTDQLGKVLLNFMSFNPHNVKCLMDVFSVTSCRFGVRLKALLCGLALLHCQSEEEDIKQAAIIFCMEQSRDHGDISRDHGNVTPYCAMTRLLEVVSRDVELKEVFRTVLESVRSDVIGKVKGFTIDENAHFDRNLFLNLTYSFTV